MADHSAEDFPGLSLVDGSLETSASLGVIWDQVSFSSLLFACSFPHQRACLIASISLALYNQLLPETPKCSSDISRSAALGEDSEVVIWEHPQMSHFSSGRGTRTCCAQTPL